MTSDFIITAIKRVILVGKNEYPEEKTAFLPDLRTNELILHMSGDGLVLFDGKEYDTKPGDIRFLPQGEHQNYEVYRKTRGDCIVIYFLADRPVADEAFVKGFADKEHILALFQRILTTWLSRANGYYFECLSILYRIFSEMQKSSYLPNEKYQRIKPALDLIHERFLTQKLTVAELAAASGISPTYLKQLFRARFGLSVGQYILHLKLQHASELLQLDEYSVTEIASMCGFSDLYHFSHLFKNHTGLSPREFASKYKSSK